ncbi:xylose isomerase-like protein [Mycena alexandri]|uniref:Xylose isomerase-like protein n=1 Tax=Mycena alexandri TaxID=1745969 RepID=A0AAD6T7T8_9AGAR|nr:xylose isomerase-like protein [Mycena alexandri]
MPPKFAIASLSLGNCAHHNLPTKIRTAASLGYDGIEIFIPDFEAFVNEVRGPGLHCDLFPDGRPPVEGCLEVECAKAIARLCDSLNITIPVLQPLRDFENFASPSALGSGGLAAALHEAERWLKLMPHLNTSLLLVCSNYIEPKNHPFAPSDPVTEPIPPIPTQPEIKTVPPGPAPSPFFPPPTQEQLSTYLDTQVEAFTALGEIAERYGVRIGYEPLAWGTMVDNWEQVWDVVRRVDRKNVGVILDSFNCLANQYADPTVSSTFLRNSASCSQTPISSLSIPTPQKHELVTTHLHPQNATHSALLQNLALLALTIPGHKIFLYQVADAGPPCSSSSTIEPTPCAPARMTWSRAARLFPCEEERGGWLPVTDISLAVVEAGYPALASDTCRDGDAWWSLEVFNNSLMDPRPECVAEHGLRGLEGVRTLWERVCAGIEAAKDDREVQSPMQTDDSQSSDGGAVLSDSETSEEIKGEAVGNGYQAGRRKVSTKWIDGCIVG